MTAHSHVDVDGTIQARYVYPYTRARTGAGAVNLNSAMCATVDYVFPVVIEIFVRAEANAKHYTLATANTIYSWSDIYRAFHSNEIVKSRETKYKKKKFSHTIVRATK